MSKTTFVDGNAETGTLGTIVAAAFLNALNNHRHTGRDIDGDGAIDYAVATGSSNAYAVTLSPALDANIAGMPIVFKANHTNTGAATLNVNELGAVSIVKKGALPLEAGDIVSGQIVIVVYDGTNYQMGSQAGNGLLSMPSGFEMFTTHLETPPAGYLEQDGSLHSMTTYEALYSTSPLAIGNKFGLDTGATVTFTNGTNTLNATSHGLTDNDLIELSNSGGALPAELSAGTTYYVVNAATNTYQISATKGGSAIAFTDDGTGTSKFHTEFALDDKRGRFLRGWDHGASVDPDAASRTDRGDGMTGDHVGTKQADQMQRITGSVPHIITANSAQSNGALSYAEITADTLEATGSSRYRVTLSLDSANSPNAKVSSSTDGETRPTNINVMWCIKY